MRYLVILFIILFPALSSAEDIDSTKTADTTQVLDSLLNTTDADSSLSDTLTPAQRAYEEFKKREAVRLDSLQKEEEKRIVNYFSFSDSLKSKFLSEKIDEMPELTRSFYRDAGDYYKLNPAYFRIEYEPTPQRKTIQPYGLTGDKVDLNINGLKYNPFEHNVEPDGLMDFNEIPTSLNHHIYQLDGPTGLIFGSDQAFSTLLTTPDDYDTLKTKTGMFVDKGPYDYNYVRGYMLKKFRSGKTVDLSVDYRNGTNPSGRTDQDQYQYSGKTFLPLGNNYILHLNGLAYMGKKEFFLPRAEVSQVFSQQKKEQMIDLAIERQNSGNRSSWKLGSVYQYHSSHFDELYIGRFDIRDYQFYLTHERIVGSMIAQFKITGEKDKYTDSKVHTERNSGDVSFILSSMNPNDMISFTGGAKYYEDFDFLPHAAFVYKHENKNFLSILSLGYVERVPSLHELNLSTQVADLIDYDSSSYRETGNQNLKSEQQLTSNIRLTHNLKSLTSNISVTAGRIKRGIDWRSEYVTIGSEPYFEFKPVNHDYDFVNITVREKLALGSFINLYGGGSYNSINDDDNIFNSYQPEYNLFGAGELHVYWKQRNVHFYAYGELLKSDDYLSLTGDLITNDPQVSTKLSFQIKKFRFYYIFQNGLNRIYEYRENNLISGNFVTYGFTWNFLD